MHADVLAGFRFGAFAHIDEAGGRASDGKSPVPPGTWSDRLYVNVGSADTFAHLPALASTLPPEDVSEQGQAWTLSPRALSVCLHTFRLTLDRMRPLLSYVARLHRSQLSLRRDAVRLLTL